MQPVTLEQAQVWASGLSAKLADWHAKAGNVGSPPTASVMDGPRWLRVVREEVGPSRAAYGFIDRTTGLIYKAASWKAPAKTARGSLHNADPYEGCGPYGMAYLRN